MIILIEKRSKKYIKNNGLNLGKMKMKEIVDCNPKFKSFIFNPF